MSNSNWKREERKVAAIFGTSRRLMKGTDEKSDIGDDDFPLMVDVKLRKKEGWAITKWFRELEAAAVAEPMVPDKPRKWPILSVREPGSGKKTRYAILRENALSDFITNRTDYVADNFFTGETTPSRITPVLIRWKQLMKLYNKRRMEVMNNLVRSQQKHTEVFPILIHRNTKANITYAILSTENLAEIFRCGGLIE